LGRLDLHGMVYRDAAKRHADIKTTLAFYPNVDDVLDEAILKG
jgi:hypothetical protein